jgi:UDP-2,3-diacylglucosamine pyrophosphatase LpxH
MKVRSLFISDCHLGSDHCNHEKLLKLLSEVECEYLYIVGDFIDGWLLSRKFKWNSNYNTILQKILRMSRKGTQVYYIWGNHDDFVETFNGFNFGDNIHVVRETCHTTLNNEKILIIHGDQFDGLVTKNKWIQHVGAIIYDYSLVVNKLFRIFKFSFSNFLKQKAKEAVKYISNYETTVVNYCRNSGYDSILCGHIHKPEITTIEGVKYYNTGDWVESNTFIIETTDGDIQLLKYENTIWSSN